MSESIALGPGREFDLVRELERRWGQRAKGIGDDAAVLDVPPGQRLVVSTDSSVEDVHFRRGWLSPAEIGYRATVAALSDLAAMAATPLGVLLALTLPPRWLGDVGALADGIGDAVAEAETQVVGGDLTGGRDLVVAVTVLGGAARVLSRRGARPGDAVFVTGALGGPRLAIDALGRGEPPAAVARDRFAHPAARIREGRWLAEHGATATVDVSDGLLSDLGHVAYASEVRIAVELDRLPLVAGADPELAASSGEEYELALAAPAELDADAFERAFGVLLTRIGDVRAGRPGVEATRGGRRIAAGGGWDHFSR